MFDEKGQIIIAKEDCAKDADDLMMLALDAGAEDFAEEEDSFEILTSPDEFETVARRWRRKYRYGGGFGYDAPADLCGAYRRGLLTNINRILDLLDADDDVQEVFHNWDEERSKAQGRRCGRCGFCLQRMRGISITLSR